jgi:probable F420-dependent oxidoreductase
MEFGVGYFPTHWGMSPGDVARMVEERGQSTLHFAEHTHIPASRESKWPGGDDLPQKYWHSYDLFVALTHAVAATSRVRIGSGICLIIERDPITTAKEIASIDRLSGGRFEFGVGAGWNREEMANHGTDPKRRMAVMRERVEAMREIWTQEEASYHGEFVNFDRIWSDPKPAQKPWPPIMVGGAGPTIFDRVLGFGDGWMPNYSRESLARIPELRERAGRNVDVCVLGMAAKPDVIERCAEAGVRRCSPWLPSGGRSVVEHALETWEAAIAEFTGEA